MLTRTSTVCTCSLPLCSSLLASSSRTSIPVRWMSTAKFGIKSGVGQAQRSAPRTKVDGTGGRYNNKEDRFARPAENPGRSFDRADGMTPRSTPRTTVGGQWTDGGNKENRFGRPSGNPGRSFDREGGMTFRSIPRAAVDEQRRDGNNKENRSGRPFETPGRSFERPAAGRPPFNKPSFPSASNRRLAQDLTSSPPRSRRPEGDSTPSPSKSLSSTAPLAALPSFNKNPVTINRFPFSDYSINPHLKEGITKFFGGETPLPTPIQTLALQYFVGSAKQPLNRKPGMEEERYQVLLGSETGSGKTLAYLLPLLHFLKKTDKSQPQEDIDVVLPRSIILAPTHELARQLTQTAKQLSHGIKLKVRGMSSTASGNLDGGIVDVLVGTTRSLVRALDRGYVKADKMEWVVVDEADVLLGPDFQEETTSLLKSFHPESASEPSLILSTATIPPSLMSFINSDSMSVHRLLSPSLHRLPTKLKTRFVPWSGSGNKLADVVHEVKRVIAADATDRALLAESGNTTEAEQKAKILIFCNTPGRVKMLADTLSRKNVPCVAWTGEGDDRVRGSNGTLDEFLRKPGQTDEDLRAEKSTAPRVLVTTSLLSRGLDFTPAVKHVFLLDEPRDMLDFLHRAGRTGRAGRIGSVVVFGDAARDRFSKMMKSTKK